MKSCTNETTEAKAQEFTINKILNVVALQWLAF